MKLQHLIICVLMYLVLTNQEEENQMLSTPGFTFDEYYFISILNSTLPIDDNESSAPCSVTVPGFNSLGLMITYIIVFVLSMVGNSVVVYVVCYMERGRASTDIYLMHLAMADLLFCFTLPFWAVKIHSGWVFGNFMCKLLSGFQEASVYSGVFLLACISVDRHFAIVRATRVLPSHHLLVKVVCSVVWLVAGVLSLPVAIQRESRYAADLGQFICYQNLTGESSNHWRVGVRILRHTVGFFLPLVVMAVCYGWIVVTLYHTRNQQKHKAMRVILAVVLAFVLCWLPHNITVLIDTLRRGGSITVEVCDTRYALEVMLRLTEVLAFMHCAVNPVLYAFIGEKFRNQLLSALYKHGLISKRLQMAFRKGSVSSAGSIRSRITSATM
ncbi:C-X-C chemokine receptor type 1 [Epinephelus lanceolatus]|uniref:C-X-C chemokine receptor type 1 n=1 Tax=Epinephelus lanceolatus TaxID=310571 RepID=UPI001444D027|nr:C-X-C chemokine receptor type 1 [Epinephelus lanceolatus]